MTVRKRAGFSLVELLCVVAIIAVLAAALVPIYAAAKRSAWRGQCQSNLSQIARAFEAYVCDHSSCYPNINDPFLWMGRHWRWPVRKYVGFAAAYDPSDPDGANQITMRTNTVLACPADPTTVAKWDRTSYGYSAAFYHTPEQIDSMTTAQLYSTPTPPCATIKSSTVKWPGKKAMVADWLSGHSDVKTGWWSWQGERNYLFADGHVRYLRADCIRPAVSPSAVRVAYPDINLTTHGVAGRDVE